MDLFIKFRKDYFNYLISVILPALIAGVSIPVLKHLLGASGYGFFSIWLNAILIGTAISTGWITQSIMLFYPLSKNKALFSKGAFTLSMHTQMIFFLPAMLVIWYFSNDIMFAFLCSMVLLVTSIQFCILPIIQSGFLSKKIIFSETIRILSYVGFAILLITITDLSYLYALFIAVLISYSASICYLFFHVQKIFKNQPVHSDEEINPEKIKRRFIKYGAPLSLWFVFAYLFSYVDKLFMLHEFGGEVQGNYQAIFDLISKSLILIISPIATSIFPILTSAHASGNKSEIKLIVKKLIFYEFGGLLIVGSMYWLFGAGLLFYILKIKPSFQNEWIGFIIICGTFIWQIAILAQKRLELKLKSLQMLSMVAIAFAAQIIFYLTFKRMHSQIIYPLGFLLSAFVYLILLSVSVIKPFFNSYSLTHSFIRNNKPL